MKTKAKNATIIKRGLLGGIVAAAVNYLMFFISKSSGVSYRMPPRREGEMPMELPSWDIVISSLVPAIVAMILLLILNRFAKNPLRIFTIIAVVFLLISFVPVVAIEVELTTKVFLGVMHIVAAASIIAFLRSAYR